MVVVVVGVWGGDGTSGGKLGALAGAAVVVSVLGAERGAGVGEAARPSSCATKSLGMQAGFWRKAGAEY